MKFITEEDLRDIYKKQPFTDYDLQPGERLTPGARQFLLDRGINMYDENDPFINSGINKAESNQNVSACADDRRKKKFCSRMKSLQALFLLTAEELMKQDVCMSQQITGLYRQFASLGTASEGKCEAADLCCKACTGINTDNFSQSIGDCFEITEFHMQLQKGHEILLLTRLRSSLEELDADIADMISNVEIQNTFSGKLNQIINTLSQMICYAVGGKECQRN